MKFFSLLNSFIIILLLNNLSCSESDNEPPRKKLKVESSDEENSTLDDDSSDLENNNEWHDLLANENFNYFSHTINKLVKENFKKLIKYEKTQNDEILKEAKALELKSSLSYKPDCRNDFYSYLKVILDTDADFKSLFKKKTSYKNAIKNEKLFEEKGFEFGYISYLLSILIKSIDTYKNRNLPEVNVIHSALVLMDKRIKALRELLKNYLILKKNNEKLYDSDLNYNKLLTKLVYMKELSSDELNWDFVTINRSMMFKYAARIFFVEFYECVEKENNLYCSIFNSMNRIISDFVAFNELKNNLIRNFD